MLTLFHQAFCPHARFIRLVLVEAGLPFELVEIKTGRENPALMAISPDGATPAVLDDNGIGAPGADVIVATLEETHAEAFGRAALLPPGAPGRVEVRRLTRWFNSKMFQEASRWILREKIEKRFLPASQGGGAPDMDVVRAARENLRYHVRHIGRLAEARNWLAGDRLSYADLAAAAQLSCVDYLGDAPWDGNEAAMSWYARIKSRPSFRPLLAERLPGMTPAATYANLDF
jgi:glutathione S-transferase